MNVFRRIKEAIERSYLSVGSSKECPICGWTGHSFAKRFYQCKPASVHMCPFCGSFERHRFAYFSLKDRLRKHSETTLHIAPETGVGKWLRSISKEYLSVDLDSPQAMLHMDITKLAFRDNHFSLLWSSHTLEHIEDDGRAMRELFRVLKPLGLAVIMVPVFGEITYENPAIKLSADRLKHFKQEDHVRLYGRDIRKRLEGAGFNVEVLSVSDLSKDNVKRYVLEYPSSREIFLCTKPKVD